MLPWLLLSINFFLFLISFNERVNGLTTTLEDLCDDGCNVFSNGLTTYHCLNIDDLQEIYTLSYISTNNNNNNLLQCLYHDISYNLSVSNITLNTFNQNNECVPECIDWNNGCTECLCIDNTSSCNINMNSIDSCPIYTEPHCQTYEDELIQFGSDVSLLIWFSIININFDDYQFFLPLTLLTDLQNIILNQLQNTTYKQYINNISCDMKYPSHYSNYYVMDTDYLANNTDILFNDSSSLNPSTTNNISFSNFTTSPSSSSSLNSTYQTTVDAHESFEFDSIVEEDGYHYNYIPQCLISFKTVDIAIDFVKTYRNFSVSLNELFLEISEYFEYNMWLLLIEDDDINDTLYRYYTNNDYLYIDYDDTNNTFYIDNWNLNISNNTFLNDDFQLTFNSSKYNIILNTISYYLGNISSHDTLYTYSPSMIPTEQPNNPQDCYYDNKIILHNQTWKSTDCYSVSCDNGNIVRMDNYCHSMCYNNKSLSNNTLLLNDSCCMTPDGSICTTDNDNCPNQINCELCLSESSVGCIWQGDSCSAICIGKYCWKNDDECPHSLIMRIHLIGIRIDIINNNQNLLNHAIALSLNITENLIKNYYVTETPSNDGKIEIKNSIYLTKEDEERIPNILINNNTKYVNTLNGYVRNVFKHIAPDVAVVDVEYGGIDGYDSGENHHKKTSPLIDINSHSFIILLICFGLIFITIALLCIKYPIFSYCCCCLSIKMRKRIRSFVRNNCCDCCMRFNFGILYETGSMNDIIRRRREERRLRNIQNRTMEQEQQRQLNELNALNVTIIDETKENEEYYTQLPQIIQSELDRIPANSKSEKQNKKKKNKNKHKDKDKKKKKKKKKKRKKHTKRGDNNTVLIHDEIDQLNDDIDMDIDSNNQEIAMTTLRTNHNKNSLLYYDRNRDVIEEEEENDQVFDV